MIKVIGVAVWICMVALGSAYGAATMFSGDRQKIEPEEFFGGIDYVKTSIISVPIVTVGSIRGYVIAQFVFTAEGKLLRQLSVPPELFFIDEAFRAIYEGDAPDFANLKKYDLDGLKKTIAANINNRYGIDIIRDVLIEQFNYVPQDQVRYGPRHQR